MLRKKIALLLAAGTLVFVSSSGHAEDEDGIGYGAKIAGKFGIGLINATTGIVEIPKTMMVESEKEGIGMGLSLGFLQGMVNMMGRTVLGMVDMLSFPIPTKPMVEPPVVFQDFNVETSYSNGWEMY